ncbi:MAG: hypothetical protein ACJ76H_05465 [Bacteriovoracaceae bacterium]
MKILFLLFCFSLSAFAGDISSNYVRHYKTGALTAAEIETLKNVEVILVPGIMSETFIMSDPRGDIDFSVLTKDYFGTHLQYLKNLGIPVRRLLASSADVEETKKEIDELLSSTTGPLLFMTHSLGGMALLDYLLAHEAAWPRVQAIIFMQSPFTGAPVASVVQRWPKLRRIFPFFNVSNKTVRYLSLEERKSFVTSNEQKISELAGKVRIITVGGVANGYKSLYANSISLIKTGCLETLHGHCVGPKLYAGPYDDSDGMSPFHATLLPGTDYVRLPAVDHGETVVHIPFKSLLHERLTAALLKLVL